MRKAKKQYNFFTFHDYNLTNTENKLLPIEYLDKRRVHYALPSNWNKYGVQTWKDNFWDLAL